MANRNGMKPSVVRFVKKANLTASVRLLEAVKKTASSRLVSARAIELAGGVTFRLPREPRRPAGYNPFKG